MAQNPSKPSNFWRWFDPRSRSVNTIGFILNRITALGLTFYLFMHLIVLGKLAQGPEAYDSFLVLAHTPVVMIGELLVIAAGLIHGLNGIRIAMTSFGWGTTRQRQILVGILVLSVIGTAYFAYKMFSV